MRHTLIRRSLYAIPVVALAVWSTVHVRGQIPSKAGDWPTYGATLASTRYLPLDQINAGNFKQTRGGLALQDRRTWPAA